MFQIRTGSAVAQFSKERPFHLRWAIVESSAFSEWVQISRITNTNLKSRQRRCKVYLVGYISTADRERLDYVEDFQDIYTSSETFDVEVFFIPSEGLFMAAANKYWLSCFNVKDCNMRTQDLSPVSSSPLWRTSLWSSVRDSLSGSGVYKWTNGSFQLYQNISTQEARAWKHFTIDEKVRLGMFLRTIPSTTEKYMNENIYTHTFRNTTFSSRRWLFCRWELFTVFSGL